MSNIDYSSFSSVLSAKLYADISNYYNGNYKTDIYENIYIAKEKSTGHTGIKYDASKLIHSLGPFR